MIFVCSIDERTLVAVPQSAWNRRAEGRRFPPGSLVRATAVEVAAAFCGARAEREPTVEFAATSADSGFLPLGEVLVEVASSSRL